MRTFVVQLLASLTLSVACAAIIYGQGNKLHPKPDLSGTWALDRSRSNLVNSSSAYDEIKISHHDPELKIVRTMHINGQPEQRELTYYTDGRGETNPTIIWLSADPDPKSPHPAETKSKTKWSGERIVTRTTLRLMAGTHVIEEDVVDEWKLSADGKTLTQTTRHILPASTVTAVVVPANRPDDKRVYTLVSK
ncbi:MAG TPA: hypothetical protein VN476_14670 [Pyrinomonadaceae bacterium]|nr:hypothetical protein [Pyrinomonadaceae bacterium]